MEGDDLTIYIGFSYNTGNKLCVLGAKIKDNDLFCHKAAKVMQESEYRMKDKGYEIQDTRCQLRDMCYRAGGSRLMPIPDFVLI